jgi:predicted phage tail protein
MKVILHGILADKFGDEHELNIATPGEAVRAFMANYPEFKEIIRNGYFRLASGTMDFGQDELNFKIGKKHNRLDIIPVPAGSGGKGIGKIIAGVVLIGFAAFGGGLALGWGASAGFLGLSYGQIAIFGLGLALSGMAEMKAPGTPKMSALEPVERRASFIFNGPENLTEQGNPIPLCYGHVVTGSVVVSSGMRTERIPL